MIRSSASELYDELHAFEARSRSDAAYPIHKTLRFGDPSTTDIYAWIIDEIGVPEDGTVLDAGCGVGYGSMRLADASNAQVHGISVSRQEVDRAEVASRDVAAKNRLTFEVSNYDDVPSQAFDLIVAVESLKHSDDLSVSLASLMHALRPGGRLVIVEDLYSGADASAIANQVAKNWRLQRLYTEDDYLAIPDRSPAQVVDLSDFVRCESFLSRQGKLLGLKLLRMVAGQNRKVALSAFVGGLYLQELYVRKLMAYKVLCFEADDSV